MILKRLRLRLTLIFVGLATVVHLIFTGLGLGIFYASLTNALNDELQDLIVESLPAVEITGQGLHLHSAPERIQTRVGLGSATIQVFDAQGVLLQKYGLDSSSKLFKKTVEVRSESTHLRSMSSPLIQEGKVIGYVQVQISTEHRDQAILHYLIAMLTTAPFILISMGIAGYVYSGIASKPIELSVSILRQFVADAGHELSTPLSIIRVSCENILLDKKSDAELVGRMETIERSVDRMNSLVQDLMTLAQVESVENRKPKQDLDFSCLVRNVCNDFSDKFKEKSLTLSFENIETVFVNGHSHELQQLLSNLLENGWRYTEAGGSVRVSLKNVGSNAVLNVEDTGVGIPPESIERIFDRFYRVDKSRSRKLGGSGLGLAIVKAIVNSHGGRIDVSSELGKGATFTVVLPAI